MIAARLTPHNNIAKRLLQSVGLLSLLLVLAAHGALAQQPEEQSYQAAPPPQDASAGYDPAAVSPDADPPSRVARLSLSQGNVSVEPASVNDFSPAELNDPLTTGDRVWADAGSVAELEAGQLAVRLGQSTDLTVTAMTDTLAQFGLAQGSVHLRTFALDPGTTTELDTPNVAVTVLQPGDVRVDVDPNSTTTTVSVLSGEVEVDGNNLQQTLEPGQRVQLAGTDPVSAQWLSAAGPDGLDTFSSQRDQAYEGAESAEQSYLNPDTVGGADLEQNGSWSQDASYGEVWYPNVAAGWQPYCYGNWTWVAPWGWTWVESEPWGFAPFHYGRWAVFGGRWGWIPGPPVVHPVYSPGLVVFVGAGSGISAWFPLGPNEPYAPWYHASALYLNRVNVTNIYSRNSGQIRAIYQTSNREMYANPLGGQQRFANRAGATVAVSQANFAAGRQVGGATMHLSAAQVSGAAVLPHPMVSPERSMVAPGAARSVPPREARPALASHKDTAIRAGAAAARPVQTGAPGNASGFRAPSNPPAPIERRGDNGQQPGASSAQPATPPAAPANEPAAPANERRGYNAQPTQPAEQPAAPAGQLTRPSPPAASAPSMTIQGGVPQQPRGTERLPTNGAPAQQQLYNRAVPPPSRPSFDQQRQAIQNTDPGRPLSPQQLDNLRENRPAGQPQVREAAPHPAPAPRSEPAPQQHSSPAPPSRSDNRR
jgi:hypothetical protein